MATGRARTGPGRLVVGIKDIDREADGCADFLPDSVGDPGAALEAVYAELRRSAGAALGRGGRGGRVGLESAELVHEAWLRLQGQPELEGLSREQLLALGGVVVRRVLVDLARNRLARKRGGSRLRVELHSGIALANGAELDPIALEEALGVLQAGHPRWARVVELHGFAGLALQEVAKLLGRTEGSVRNDWRMARAWLIRELERGSTD